VLPERDMGISATDSKQRPPGVCAMEERGATRLSPHSIVGLSSDSQQGPTYDGQGQEDGVNDANEGLCKRAERGRIGYLAGQRQHRGM